MLRLGAIGQDAARELIARYEALETKRPAEAIETLCRGSGITPDQFDEVARHPEKHDAQRFANH
jgi:hypothetical protein